MRADGPVLQRAKLLEILVAASIDKGILEDPADAGRIRPESWSYGIRQVRLRRVQVLEHSAARPVHVGTVLKNHVHKGQAEEGLTPNEFDLRRGKE